MSLKRRLSELIRGEKTSQNVIKTWMRNKLYVITAGGRLPNVTEIVGSKRIGAIMHEIKEIFEIVIVDAPPLVVSDAYWLQKWTG